MAEPPIPLRPITTAPLATAQLSDQAIAYARRAVAANTQRAYGAQLKLWEAHCETEGGTPWPADPATVANWLAARAAAGQANATLRTVVAAIRFGSIAKGLTFNTRASEIELVLKGIARAHAREPRQAAPLRGEDVTAILTGLSAAPIDVRDGALIALGYIFAARRSELSGLDYGQQGAGDGYVRVTARSIDLVLARSKTVNAGEIETVSIPRGRVPAAAAALERWISLAKVEPGEPLLYGVTKDGTIRKSRNAKSTGLHPASVLRILQSRVRAHLLKQGVPDDKATADAARYTGHSLRVGFATSAAESGSSADEIALVTRHASLEMPRRYAKQADAHRRSPFNRDGMRL